MFNNLFIYFYFFLLLFLIFFLMSIYLYFLDLSFMLEWMFYSLNTFNMEFLLLIDWISCLFISIVLLISSMIMLYSMMYMYGDIFINRFVILVSLFIFSMILMIISPNLISILFGWDGLGLTSYCLVIFYQNYSSYSSGMVTVLSNRIGDIGLLMSIGMMLSYGSWSMYMLKMNESNLLIFMILLAAITKSAQIPFSVWLPMAMSAPTPVSSLVHSSTLVTAGIYLMIRFNYFLMESSLNLFLFYLSIFTMFMSGLMANFENDLKKIIALSTLSQLGMMMMILSMGFKFLSFYHLLTHAIFKSLLFMSAGIMIHMMNNNQDIRLCGKLNEFIPFTMMSFYISSLSLMGFPFLAGFYSKDLIMEVIYLMNNNLFMLMMILLSISLTVSYSLRLMFYIFFGSSMNNMSFYYYKEDKLMNFSMIILMMLSLLIGSLLSWMFFFDDDYLFMKINIKLLTMMLMILGIFFGFLMYFMNWIKLLMLSYFFSSMWFMNYMYLLIYKPFLLIGNEFMKFDKSWIELKSKNFILLMFIKLNFFYNNYKMYMFILIIFYLLFIIFFFY